MPGSNNVLIGNKTVKERYYLRRRMIGAKAPQE
jgi:hypothetical protein